MVCTSEAKNPTFSTYVVSSMSLPETEQRYHCSECPWLSLSGRLGPGYKRVGTKSEEPFLPKSLKFIFWRGKICKFVFGLPDVPHHESMCSWGFQWCSVGASSEIYKSCCIDTPRNHSHQWKRVVSFLQTSIRIIRFGTES